MRALSCFFLFVISCQTSGALEFGAPGDDDADPRPPGQGMPDTYCTSDGDCVLVGATCCECPTFAVSTHDPYNQACEDIECPMRECTANVSARCNLELSACELACVPTACELTDCPSGYAVDAATGCVTCACAGPPMDTQPACQLDTDCVRTRADCCGCTRGGTDTAVLASEQAAYDQMLGCMDDPQCPDVNTCAMGEEPRCVQGVCQLIVGDLPPGACGRADLPACPAGQVCVVNANDQANMYGVGVCGSPP